MTQEYYIKRKEWFAWYPVKTTDAGWKWLTKVKKITDERPVEYLGLLPINYYCSLNYLPPVGSEVFVTPNVRRDLLFLDAGKTVTIVNHLGDEFVFKLEIKYQSHDRELRDALKEEEIIYIPE